MERKTLEGNMTCRVMTEEDIDRVVPVYIEHYNMYEDSEWTKETAYKKIHQVWKREDSFCLILEEADVVLGFVIGEFSQYDDLIAYNLEEIVIAHDYQNQGIGTKFMYEIDCRVKEKGASMIQLQAVNDEMHERFYGNLGYKNCTNLVLKSKWL